MLSLSQEVVTSAPTRRLMSCQSMVVWSYSQRKVVDVIVWNFEDGGQVVVDIYTGQQSQEFRFRHL